MLYLENIFYVYTVIATTVCAVGWFFEKMRAFPHAVFFCARVGRCACFALLTVLLSVSTHMLAARDYPEYAGYIEWGALMVALAAVWYSLVHIHASYRQISVMWQLYKRLENHVYAYINQMDRERFMSYVEEMHADEVFRHVDPQYHILFEADALRLAAGLGLIEGR